MIETINHIFTGLGMASLAAALIVTTICLSRIRRYLPALMKYRHLLFCMVARDIKVKYRRSVLGLLWSILQPLFIMLILTAVFSQLFHTDIESFPVYYITGSFVFNFVHEATTSSLGSIFSNANLMKKVYIPKYIFPLEKCLFATVNMLFSLIAVAIVFAILRTSVHLTIILLPLLMLYTFIFSLGLALALSATVVFFRDVAHIYAIWSTAWMYLTPILYPLSILPEFLQTIVQFNPLVHYVGYARDVMLNGIVPGLEANFICIGFALTTLAVGLLIFKRTQDRFLLNV